MEAQAKSDVTTAQITELVKTLELDATTSAKTATDLQARLSAADHDEEKEIAGLKEYLGSLSVTESNMDAATETWRKLHAEKVSGVVKDAPPPSSNGTKPILIEDVRGYKAGLPVSAAARPVKDLSEYEELDSKL